LSISTGIITGTPTAITATATYTVTAANTGGSATASLNVAVVSPLQSWRQQYFGTTSNTGNAADNADPYGTGIQNLLAFAFFGPNQDPATAAVSQLPQMQMSGDNLFFSFTQPDGIDASPTAPSGTRRWVLKTGIDCGYGTGSLHIFVAPIGSNSRMLFGLS